MLTNWNYGDHWTRERTEAFCKLIIMKGGYCRQVATLLAFAREAASTNVLGAMARLAYNAAEPLVATKLSDEEYRRFQKNLESIVYVRLGCHEKS